jgi:hypothetical protein
MKSEGNDPSKTPENPTSNSGPPSPEGITTLNSQSTCDSLGPIVVIGNVSLKESGEPQILSLDDLKGRSISNLKGYDSSDKLASSISSRCIYKVTPDLDEIFANVDENMKLEAEMSKSETRSSISGTVAIEYSGLKGSVTINGLENLFWGNNVEFSFNLPLERALFDLIEKYSLKNKQQFRKPTKHQLLFSAADGRDLTYYTHEPKHNGASTVLITKQVIFLFYRHQILFRHDLSDEKFRLDKMSMVDNRTKPVVMIDVGREEVTTALIELIKVKNSITLKNSSGYSRVEVMNSFCSKSWFILFLKTSDSNEYRNQHLCCGVSLTARPLFNFDKVPGKFKFLEILWIILRDDPRFIDKHHHKHQFKWEKVFALLYKSAHFSLATFCDIMSKGEISKDTFLRALCFLEWNYKIFNNWAYFGGRNNSFIEIRKQQQTALSSTDKDTNTGTRKIISCSDKGVLSLNSAATWEETDEVTIHWPSTLS